MIRTLVGALISVLAAVPAFGGGGVIDLLDSPSPGNCVIVYETPIMQIEIVHYGSDGTQGASFQTLIPSCWQTAVHLADIIHVPIGIGNTHTGIIVGYGECRTDVVHVATKWVTTFGAPSGCCQLRIQPHPGLPEVFYPASTDCDGNTEPVGGGCGTVTVSPPDCFCPVCPHEVMNPYPPDGAVGVPTDVQLGWDEPALGPPIVYRVWLGENAAPPEAASDLTETTFNPGTPLTPNTTYYWRIEGCGTEISQPQVGPCAYGYVWSFTTEGPVPTKQRSWGFIKELFRAEETN